MATETVSCEVLERGVIRDRRRYLEGQSIELPLDVAKAYAAEKPPRVRILAPERPAKPKRARDARGRFVKAAPTAPESAGLPQDATQA